MADLTNPVVTVVYLCGCTFTDDTPLDGIVVPEHKDPEGNTVPQQTLAKAVAFRFGKDETQVFRKLREARAKLQSGELDRDDIVRFVERLLGRKLTAAQVTRVRSATLAQLKARLYDELLQQTTGLPARVADPETGVVFPQVPGTCPRHGQPAIHTHASYLNPADLA